MSAIGSKLVYTTKLESDGSVERLKASLVAQGYFQMSRVYFDETFILVINPTSIRIILSIGY